MKTRKFEVTVTMLFTGGKIDAQEPDYHSNKSIHYQKDTMTPSRAALRHKRLRRDING